MEGFELGEEKEVYRGSGRGTSQQALAAVQSREDGGLNYLVMAEVVKSI